jgi:hypothetical protein
VVAANDTSAAPPVPVLCAQARFVLERVWTHIG